MPESTWPAGPAERAAGHRRSFQAADRYLSAISVRWGSKYRSLPTAIGYSHWLAAEVPSDRVRILREAYARDVLARQLAEREKDRGAMLAVP